MISFSHCTSACRFTCSGSIRLHAVLLPMVNEGKIITLCVEHSEICSEPVVAWIVGLCVITSGHRKAHVLSSVYHL